MNNLGKCDGLCVISYVDAREILRGDARIGAELCVMMHYIIDGVPLKGSTER